MPRQMEIVMAFGRNPRDGAHASDGAPGGSRAPAEGGPGDLASLIVDEITWYMREHKLSRAQLAQAMSVSPGRISQILSGDGNLTLRTLSSVFAALDAQVDFTLRPNDEPVDLLEASDDPDEFEGHIAPVRGAAAAVRS